jgi:hypothetical protein
MQTNDKIVLGFFLFLLGLWLLQNPNCRRGCRTVVEHLLTDGLDRVIATLLA